MQIGTRPNRFLGSIVATISKKVPRDIAADELNVVLGLGTQTLAAAGAFTLDAVVPRDCFLRDLLMVAPTGGVVTAITVNGDALVLGEGVPVEAFAFGNLNRPEFGLPVKGGTQVVVQGIQGATANAFIGASFAID
jgi:hypothetical protein